MEAIAAFGLVGLGYLVTKLSWTKTNEPYQNADTMGSPLQNAQQGNSVKATNQELDIRYATPFGQIYSSEPNPGPRGSSFAFGGVTPPAKATYPAPEPIDTATPQVALNRGGIEENPSYIDSDNIISPLSCQQIASSDFTHNNMVPFFGSKVRQNVGPQTNSGILDSYTGSGITQIKKQEVETMFNTAQTPFGNPFGLENSSQFLEDRIELPRNRGGEKPFEPVRVGAGVGEKFGSTGKGGFQQMEINQLMMEKMPKTDDLRTSDNPKQTYKGQIVPGQRFIANASTDAGEVRKYKPDTFYID